MINYYEIFNLDQTLSAEEIRKFLNQETRKWTQRVNAPKLEIRQEAETMINYLGESRKHFENEESKRLYDQQLQETYNYNHNDTYQQQREEEWRREQERQQYEKKQREQQERQKREEELRNQRRAEEQAVREKERIELERSKITDIDDEVDSILKLYNDNDYEKAIDKIKIALIDYSNRNDLWRIKGLIERRQRKYNDAKESFRKAISLNKNDDISLAEFGFMSIDLDNKSQVESILRDFQKISKSYNAVKYSAYAFCYLGQFKFAYKYVEDNISFVPPLKNDEIYENLITKEVHYMADKGESLDDIVKTINRRSLLLKEDSEFTEKLILDIDNRTKRKFHIDIHKQIPVHNLSLRLLALSGIIIFITLLKLLSYISLMGIGSIFKFIINNPFSMILTLISLTYVGGFYIDEVTAKNDLRVLKNREDISYKEIFKRSVIAQPFVGGKLKTKGDK